ncbi:hypothetical protein DFQ04_3188 [Algoriphagus boseongensis]|uniref:Addiction module component n=1 Tax=Algoriphagus boseongensis TaxID=1442587 RepID=A0A4R6T522_9BACT|nr:hypothetical protein [Algoriphagus boseongensis]TDQ14600.1 hypothetical protein DFQ04_3188 [Algoriphagus boseongensis]
MNAEKLKLTIIQRVMKIDSKSSLERIEELLIREEMQRRADESIEDIKAGRVHSLEEFKQMNEKWLKERGLK